jgi:DNA polymerase III epsilon subunit-like protein
MSKILVLDTETTGFANYPKKVSDYFKSLSASEVKKEKEDPIYLEHKPKILQLSYILYDLDNPKSAKIYDKYILPEKSLTDKIAPSAAKVHGITKESLMKKPKTMFTTIEDAIYELKRDVESCDVFVGHNIDFDIDRIEEEVQRTGITVFKRTNNIYQSLLDEIKKKKYDTMKETKHTCNIPGKKPGSIKNPKLSEAYKYFFDDEPNKEALHNALVDIVVCLRVYVKHVHDRDICGENKEITRWIEFLSSIQGYKCDEKIDALASDSIEKVLPVSASSKTHTPVAASSKTHTPVAASSKTHTTKSKTKDKSKSIWSCIGSLCYPFTRRKRNKIGVVGGRKTMKQRRPLLKK